MASEILNHKDAINRLCGDLKLYQEVCQEFKTASIKHLKEIEFDHEKDISKTVRALHLLTTISRHVGAEKLASLSGSLELDLRKNKAINPSRLANLKDLIGEACKKVEEIELSKLSKP